LTHLDVYNFCTDHFSTSLAGLWVCSNERAPSTPLQQSLGRAIELSLSTLLSCRACARAHVEDIPLSFVCAPRRHLLCCFFWLLFLTWTFQHFDLQCFVSCARCYSFLFFSQKEYPHPSWQSIPSYTRPKNSVTQNHHLGILAAHTIYPPTSLWPSFGLFFFFVASAFLFFFLSSRFLSYEKKKICLIRISTSSLTVRGGFAVPPNLITDTWLMCSQSPSGL
jgi:hypothetical protein